MPIYSKYYNLQAFVSGEPYSAVVDRDRFFIIDTQIGFISSVFGNGRITGLATTDATAGGVPQVQVSSGQGLINKYVARTFGNMIIEATAGSTSYVYIQRKPGLFGLLGPFCSPHSFTWADVVAPAVPVGLALSDVTKNSLTVDWDDSAEADFNNYILERTDDGGATWSTIVSPTVSTYADSGLTENTAYSYRVSAIDASGNNSGPSGAVGTTTLQDLVPASLPSYFVGFPGDGEMSFVWGENKSPFPDSYILRIQELDYEGNPTGSSTDYDLDIDDHNFILDGMTNTVLYSCTLYSVNANGVLSDGFNVKLSPQTNLGPAEVENVILSSLASDRNPNSLMFDLAWDAGIDVYKPPAFKYAVTFIENGYKESDPVYVYENISDFSIDTFVSDGICYPILSKTDYIVKIQGVDEDGDISNGVVQRIYTGISVSPPAPSSISANLDNNGLEFIWKNNAPYLDHNLVTVVDRDIDAESDTDIVTATNIGLAKSYVVPYASLIPNHRYTIQITAVDPDGNTSGEVNFYYTVLPIDYSDVWGGYYEGERPPQVDEVNAFGGDGAILLIWEDVKGVSVDEYHIWKADFIRNEYYIASNFSLVASVSSDTRSFVDYSVTNGTRAVYFITITDTFGHSTLNPVDDEYVNHVMVNALPINGKSGLDAPTDVTLTNPVGFNALLTWTAVSGDFDCYEIYTSVGDLTSWTKVDSVDIGTVTYTHSDAFIQGDGNYFYMIRAARNEGRLLIRSSTVNPPIHSILLAEVVSTGDSVTSIEDEARDLYQLETYITEKVTPWVNEHVHNITGAYDRRIDLAPNIVISDWVTADQQTYFTLEQIFGSAESSDLSIPVNPSYYVVKIDGTITNIPYTVIPSSRTIVFDYPTGSNILSVECGGINETTGVIREKRLVSFDGSQSESGKLHAATLPNIPHDVRRYEKMVPLQLPTETVNGYTYSIYQNNHTANEQFIGDAITFYDFIESIGGDLIAATSRGLLISENDGEDWSVLRATNNIIHTLFYDATVGKFLGLANGMVYISDTGDSWATTNGLDNVSIVRSAVSDGDYLYISTDLGVFILRNDSLGNLLTWEEVPFYSGQTTDTYGMLYDTFENRLVISSEVGIFQSTDDGDSWHLTQEIQEPAPVWMFFESGGYFFALTDFGIWRKHNSAVNFSKIAYFDADIARKIEVFEGRLVISTDEGIMISSEDYNIYFDTDISFDIGLSLIDFSAKITPVTGMKQLSSILYIGTDERVYSGDDFDTFELMYQQSSTIIPTVYINGVEQVIGFHYDIINNTAYFDRRISSLSSVTIANQYSHFKAENGKWIDEDYNSNVMVYGRTGLVAALVNGYPPINELNAVSFDTFTEDNSNASIADSYVSEYQDAVARLSAVLGGAALATGETTKSLVENCVYWYYKTYSQAYGNVIYGDLKTIDSRSYLVVDNVMYLSDIAEDFLSGFVVVETISDFAFTSNLTTNITANASDGSFSFAETNYNKYDTMYVNISGTGITEATTYTHKELEDTFEMYNSGMSYLLAEVNQVNSLKESLFLERNGVVDPMPGSQAKYHIPFDRSWYSVIDSTVDYSEQLNCVGLGVSMFYPTSVNYYAASGKVFVGYNKGLVSIDVDTLDITSINFNNNEEEYVQDIFVYSGTLCVLTDMRLYASSDYGVTWVEQETYGLNGSFRRMWSFKNMLLFSTDRGIFWKYVDDVNWEQVSTISDVTQFFTDKGVFALAGNKLYYSESGYQWDEKGSFGDEVVSQVRILNTLAFLPTDKGLRHDGTSRFGDGLGTTLIDLEGDTEVSVELKVNSIAINSDNNQYVAGGKNGYYYTWNLGSDIITKTASGMDSIYKIIYVNGQYWMFGNDSLLRVTSLPMPIKISTGVPF